MAVDGGARFLPFHVPWTTPKENGGRWGHAILGWWLSLRSAAELTWGFSVRKEHPHCRRHARELLAFGEHSPRTDGTT